MQNTQHQKRLKNKMTWFSQIKIYIIECDNYENTYIYSIYFVQSVYKKDSCMHNDILKYIFKDKNYNKNLQLTCIFTWVYFSYYFNHIFYFLFLGKFQINHRFSISSLYIFSFQNCLVSFLNHINAEMNEGHNAKSSFSSSVLFYFVL
jgi:hypothetical protein